VSDVQTNIDTDNHLFVVCRDGEFSVTAAARA